MMNIYQNILFIFFIIVGIVFAYNALFEKEGWFIIFLGALWGAFVSSPLITLIEILKYKNTDNFWFLRGWIGSVFLNSCWFYFKYKDSSYPQTMEDYFSIIMIYAVGVLVGAIFLTALFRMWFERKDKV